MRRFFTIAWRECLDQLLSGKFWVLGGVVVLVALVSSASRVARYKEQQQGMDTVDYQFREHLINTEYRWAVYQTVMPSELNPASIIVMGYDPDGIPVFSVSDMQASSLNAVYNFNPIRKLFPYMDMAFLVGVVMSLMVFVLSFDLVCGEREGGTLKLVFSYPVARSQFMLAKAAGAFFAVTIPFVASMVILFLAMVVEPLVGFDQDLLLICLVFLSVSLLYLAFMFSLGTLVSVLVQRTTTAISVLILIWVMLVLIIPNAVPYVVSSFHQVKTKEELSREKQAIHREYRKNRREEERALDNDIGLTPQQKSEEKQAIRNKYRTLREKEQSALQKDWERSVEVRNEWVRGVSRLSPLVSYLQAASAITATGADAQERREDSLEEYEKSVDNYIFTIARTNYNRENLPRYRPQPVSLKQRVQAAFLDMSLLGVEVVLVFLIAFLAFLQSDIM